MESPWGSDNAELFKIYSDASADDYECPTVVTNNEHKSCGQSRFGCWVCTVVKEDKSMTALINNGLTWLSPLLKFRNQLAQERNIIENRLSTRRNKTEAINGMGSYTPIYRADVLRRLLETQKEVQILKPHIELITNQELIAIQVIWYRDLLFTNKVSDIYNNIFKNQLDMKQQEEKNEKELQLLQNACDNNKNDFELIQELLMLQKNKSLLNRKRGLKDDIENRIEEFIKKAN